MLEVTQLICKLMADGSMDSPWIYFQESDLELPYLAFNRAGGCTHISDMGRGPGCDWAGPRGELVRGRPEEDDVTCHWGHFESQR